MKKMDFHFPSMLSKRIERTVLKVLVVLFFAVSATGVTNAQIPTLLEGSDAIPVLVSEIDQMQSASNLTVFQRTQLEYYITLSEVLQTPGVTTESAIFSSFTQASAALTGATSTTLPGADEYYVVLSSGGRGDMTVNNHGRVKGSNGTMSHAHIDAAITLLRQ